MKTNLLGMSLDAMEKFFVSLGEKPYRARQVFQWIHQKGISNFDEMSNLSKDLKCTFWKKKQKLSLQRLFTRKILKMALVNGF